MIPALRLLEEWTTHQDYVWFLALLAWGGVLAAEIRRGENMPEGRLEARGWLIVLAASGLAGALLELVLLAQNFLVPYTKIDAAMGAVQALGAAALTWSATQHSPRAI